jgi:hypothetical protein
MHDHPRPRFVIRSAPKVEERRTIPVAKVVGDSDILCDSSGSAVWPLRGDHHRTALEATARVFAGDLVETPAEEGKDVSSGPEIVLGVGELGDEAALYAHLTGRKHDNVSSVDEIRSEAMPAVLIVLSPTIDPSLIEFLCAVPYGPQAPGIIWGRTRDELRRRVLTASAAAALVTAEPGAPVDVIGPHMSGLPETPGTSDELAEALGKGAGILTLFTHSEGIAVELPAGTTMCVRGDEETAGDPRRGPECAHTGICRLGIPVAEAAASKRILPPEAIAGRIVISCGCQTVFVGSPALDPDWSLFSRLASNPRIGALLASPQIFLVNVEGVKNELVAKLRDGISVGAALAGYDRLSTTETAGCRLLLFGDPKVRAGIAEDAQSPAAISINNLASQDEITQPARQEPGDAGDLAMLRVIAELRRHETRPQCELTARTLLERIVELEDSVESSPSKATADALRTATLEHLASTKPRLSDAWSSRALHIDLGPRMRCPHCGLLAPIIIVHLDTGATRESLKCIACGDVMDHQAGSVLRPMVRAPEITLQGDCTDTDWAGTILLVRLNASKTVILPWPARSDGAPVTRFSVKHACPPGPLHLYAVFIGRFVVNTTTQFIPGGPASPIS